MKIGAVLPASWLVDVGALRDVAQGLDEAGFDHVGAGGHILTAASGRYPDAPDERYAFTYRDPFVLYADLAARTRQLKFRPAVLILPLYPTALVARQAADLSLLSDGRLELGVGISWQEAEYRALGQSMHDRGQRLEEQIELLRRFWTEPLVTFEGRYHQIDGLGLQTLPAAPIPIHIGCAPTERLLDRVARLGDGWLPTPPDLSSSASELLHARVRAAGRRVEDLQITGRLSVAAQAQDAWGDRARALVGAHATQLEITLAGEIEPEAGLELMIAAAAAVREALPTG